MAASSEAVSEQSLRDVVANLHGVTHNIARISQQLGRKQEPRLVAVSKTKPVSLIRACYDAGHRDFGENYVQEIIEKAPQLPSDVRWHFIGHLQSNKVKSLLVVPNLSAVETVDSEKLARTLNKHAQEMRHTPLRVFVQVNTSGEESKSGVHPSECVRLVQFIVAECASLRFTGLMTIGEPAQGATDPNADFKRLVECLAEVRAHVALEKSQCELSMGMSQDYPQAIEHGSTNVRVGSVIFGARAYPPKT